MMDIAIIVTGVILALGGDYFLDWKLERKRLVGHPTRHLTSEDRKQIKHLEKTLAVHRGKQLRFISINCPDFAEHERLCAEKALCRIREIKDNVC